MKTVFHPMILLLVGQAPLTGAQTKPEQAGKTKAITAYLENSLKI